MGQLDILNRGNEHSFVISTRREVLVLTVSSLQVAVLVCVEYKLIPRFTNPLTFQCRNNQSTVRFSNSLRTNCDNYTGQSRCLWEGLTCITVLTWYSRRHFEGHICTTPGCVSYLRSNLIRTKGQMDSGYFRIL